MSRATTHASSEASMRSAGGRLAVTRSAVVRTCAHMPQPRLALMHTCKRSRCHGFAQHLRSAYPNPSDLPWGRHGKHKARLEARALRASADIPAWRHQRAGTGWPRLRPLMACLRRCHGKTCACRCHGSRCPQDVSPRATCSSSPCRVVALTPLDHCHRRQNLR
mgnify:CR=1 FL=1